MTVTHRGIRRLAYVRIGLPDLAGARDFYTNTVGMLELDSVLDGLLVFRCWHEAYAYSLLIEQSPEPRLVELGFQVRDGEDLDELAARARGAGATTDESTSLPGTGRSVLVSAPTGLSIRLFAEQDVPGFPAGQRSTHWNAPKAIRGTAAPMFLVHTAVTSSDPAGLIRFLEDGLGFQASEVLTSDDGSAVLSALLFRTTNGFDVAVYPGPDGGLHSLGWGLEDEVDVMRVGTYLRNDGARIDPIGPTRRSYGKTFSLFFYDPWGTRLEVFAGGRYSELHPDFVPVRWTEGNLSKALSFYDASVDESFLAASW